MLTSTRRVCSRSVQTIESVSETSRRPGAHYPYWKRWQYSVSNSGNVAVSETGRASCAYCKRKIPTSSSWQLQQVRRFGNQRNLLLVFLLAASQSFIRNRRSNKHQINLPFSSDPTIGVHTELLVCRSNARGLIVSTTAWKLLKSKIIFKLLDFAFVRLH